MYIHKRCALADYELDFERKGFGYCEVCKSQGTIYHVVGTENEYTRKSSGVTYVVTDGVKRPQRPFVAVPPEEVPESIPAEIKSSKRIEVPEAEVTIKVETVEEQDSMPEFETEEEKIVGVVREAESKPSEPLEEESDDAEAPQEKETEKEEEKVLDVTGLSTEQLQAILEARIKAEEK